MNIKHSVSSPSYIVWGKFFCKKALHGVTNVFGQIYSGMFYMGTNDQIKQVGEIMVKTFQRSSQVTFPPNDLDLGC